jgi:hypothetical protein
VAKSVDNRVATILHLLGRFFHHRSVHVEVNKAAESLRQLKAIGEQVDRHETSFGQHYSEIFEQELVFLS